jgi:hypothetical protein
VKKKKTPPSQFIVDRLRQASSRQEVIQALNEVRFVGDVKQLAESYGLHFLKSKRMRCRELRKWIIDNHPAVKEANKRAEDQETKIDEPQMMAGIDWGTRGGSAVTVVETQPDGSLKILNAEVKPDGLPEPPSGTD